MMWVGLINDFLVVANPDAQTVPSALKSLAVPASPRSLIEDSEHCLSGELHLSPVDPQPSTFSFHHQLTPNRSPKTSILAGDPAFQSVQHLATERITADAEVVCPRSCHTHCRLSLHVLSKPYQRCVSCSEVESRVNEYLQALRRIWGGARPPSSLVFTICPKC